MSSVTERERKSQDTLSFALQEKLGFEVDEAEEWLAHDKFVCVGGISHYEWLPAKARVSLDGSRYEIGTRKEDLEGLLALAKIIHPEAQNVDRVINFWDDHPRFSAKEEGEWIYIGANIEPTTDGFEREANSIYWAYDLALSAAIEDKIYEQMLEEKRYKSLIRQAENPPKGVRTVFFDRGFIERVKEASCTYEETDSEKIVTVDTLREFPLATYKTSISFAPGILVSNGETRELDGIGVQAYNGNPEVLIYDSDSHYDEKKEKWERWGFRLVLPIPGDLQLRTVEDLTSLSFAKLEFTDDDFKVVEEKEMEMRITVGDDLVRMMSEDGNFVLEIKKPACDRCKIPVWQFPYSSAPYIASSGESDFYSVNSSLGILRFLVDDDGKKKTYCGNCIDAVVDDYVKKNPFVSKPRATEVARRRLDEASYEGVEIWEDQVWHWGKKWEFLTKIEYERDGRKIMRHCGIPTLTDDGHFELNMHPHEYVAFRA